MSSAVDSKAFLKFQTSDVISHIIRFITHQYAKDLSTIVGK